MRVLAARLSGSTCSASPTTTNQDASSAAASSGMVWRPVSGNSETTAERLIEVAQARFTFFNLIPDGPGRLERFAAEVMPAVRREAGRVA
jgi:hypothetical protein